MGEVEDYGYLGVVIDNKLDRAPNTTAVYKKGTSRPRPEKAEVQSRVHWDVGDDPPVCCHQRHRLCFRMLRQHQNRRNQKTSKDHQEDVQFWVIKNGDGSPPLASSCSDGLCQAGGATVTVA